jgi:P-type Cu2+ transporter
MQITLDVQGLHCAGCIWLMQELFKRMSGTQIVINSALGRASFVLEPQFDLEGYITRVESFGYLFGPASDSREAASVDLVWRMGVCVAIAMNTMILAIATYAGLSVGTVYVFFQDLTFCLSFVSVFVGGSIFFRSAFAALRNRVLHMDVPIALGIASAFVSSTYTYRVSGGDRSYFDTLNVFIALMVLGRFLQERVVLRNRRTLLSDEGVSALQTRRLCGVSLSLVPVTHIEKGDRLVIAPGDLVPVSATLELRDPPEASFSLDWISGESRGRSFRTGESIPAGAFSSETQAVVVVAETAFERSLLRDLLATPSRRAKGHARQTAFWQKLTGFYVVAVLSIAATAFAAWLLVTGDLARAAAVLTAILIVTCPCAFGTAAPLAYELAQAGLRRAGLFVRTSDFLDRATEIRKVVFDKTGTLTTGEMRLSSPGLVLEALSAADRQALHNMVVRSSHPKSRALRLILEASDAPARFKVEARVTENAGLGLEMETYKLGSSRFTGAGKGDVTFTRAGALLAEFELEEVLRPDALAELTLLKRDGYQTGILSGDNSTRVQALAGRVCLRTANAVGDQSPQDKLRWIERSPHTLFIGDGINDGLAADAAFAAGTPAIDRPFMAARSDFYFTTPGLRPIRLALRTARKLQRVVKRNLAVAIAYNVITVTLAALGKMSPLLCAVVMPVSSLSLVFYTTRALGRRSSLWTS